MTKNLLFGEIFIISTNKIVENNNIQAIPGELINFNNPGAMRNF